jgi:predicted hydrocarbon binding protein
MKEYGIEEIGQVARPILGDDIPLVLYRTLRIVGMRNILGDSSGAALYMVGKQIGNMIGAADLSGVGQKIRELKVGIPEITVADEDSLVVKLYECITCAGFSYTGEMFCDMESGIIAGLLESACKKRARSTQTKSWSLGFDYCEFDVMLF